VRIPAKGAAEYTIADLDNLSRAGCRFRLPDRCSHLDFGLRSVVSFPL